MLKNTNCTTIVITLEGTENIKTEKKWQQNSKNYLLHQRCEKTVINTVMASQPWLAAYVVRLFDSHFKNGLFQRAKIHFSPPNSPFKHVTCATMPDKVVIIIVCIMRKYTFLFFVIPARYSSLFSKT